MPVYPQSHPEPPRRQGSHLEPAKLRRLVLLFFAAAVLVISGCSATTTFGSYPRKIAPLIADIRTRTPVDFSRTLANERTGNDRILYNMELARAAQIMDDPYTSMAAFDAAMEKIRENDRKAVISASDIGANVAATMVNDNAIPYEGEGYERVMLHHYQAVNFLRDGDLEGAGVEVRRANAEQEEALKRFAGEIEEARNESESRHLGVAATGDLDSRYAQLDEIAGTVKNSFQNAYTFYLSGFIYELLQQPGDAYIDYKKALEIYPENSYLQKDVIRLASSLGMQEDLDQLKARFKTEPDTGIGEDNTGDGELLVIFEDGFVPRKSEIKIPLPVPRVGIVAIAFPFYSDRWNPPSSLAIIADDQLLGRTEPVCDFRALAVKALKEKVPVIATRQIIRAAAKGATTRQLEKDAGPLAGFFSMIWNIVSENADLRSWLTLPATAQILRTTLPADSHRLQLRFDGKTSPIYTDIDIEPAGKTILHVIRAGEQVYVSTTFF